MLSDATAGVAYVGPHGLSKPSKHSHSSEKLSLALGRQHGAVQKYCVGLHKCVAPPAAGAYARNADLSNVVAKLVASADCALKMTIDSSNLTCALRWNSMPRHATATVLCGDGADEDDAKQWRGRRWDPPGAAPWVVDSTRTIN